MKIAEYFETIKDRLFIVSFVADFKVVKQVDRSNNGHLRMRVTFTDNSQLEFSEFIEQGADDEIRVVTYSYHWADETKILIRRWDNTPHHPKLEHFPHHIHHADGQVLPDQAMDIFAVLDEIEQMIGN